jgi:hypothetical protein
MNFISARFCYPRLFALAIFSLFLVGCAAPVITPSVVNVRISTEGSTARVTVPTGSTVQDVLDAAGVTLDSLDRTTPPTYTIVLEGTEITVIRVTEEFFIEELVIPFDKQLVRNESLPEGETRLIQPGVNGMQEITYRKVFEDGVEVSTNPVKTVVLQEASPEIVMVGSQSPFTSIPVSGRLAFLSAGNAWIVEGTSNNRRPIVDTGDLDGRVFRLSPNGEWLLFTRRAEDEDTINTLWVAKIDGDEPLLIDLGVANIIHFADWDPTTPQRVAYSTVEPRATAPGWQANNNLELRIFSDTGWVSPQPDVLLETNSGGIYGWWGMDFAFSPDGSQIAYTRPDGIGLLNVGEEETEIVPALTLAPLQTLGDWAWVPGLTWSPGGDMLFTVNHGEQPGTPSRETSQVFDLTGVALSAGAIVDVVPQVGMFANPVISPILPGSTGELSVQIAYLQAVFPTQSETSRYRLMLMDRDGSNKQMLFPEEGAPGLDPQRVYWSPTPLDHTETHWIAFLYQGNLWMVDSVSGAVQQLTGDGLIDRLDWK